MFEVEKPRRFHYEPRFYDPEKEKWEALKKKYAIEQEPGVRADIQEPVGKATGTEATDSVSEPTISSEETGLDYFENRLRDLDRQKREASSRLTWRDLFRKREMPRFEYRPRFSPEGMRNEELEIRNDGTEDELVQKYATPRHRIKIRRRFDIADSDYMKPIPGTKIILYTGIVCLLLAVIFLL